MPCTPKPGLPHPHACPSSPEVLETLVRSHRAFLTFVERRVGSRDLAEEILQSAFARNLDKLGAVRETAIGWFYTVLRNAIIDHRRRRTVEDGRHDRFVADAASAHADDHELRGVICTCVAELARTLKPEYADALRQVELEGRSVKDYAARTGISPSNAGVRVFRARAALRRQVLRSCGTCAAHGCHDCTCVRIEHDPVIGASEGEPLKPERAP